MSNFAQRLVARSAGTPPGPGISVLAPRPMSRFEPVAGIEVEEAVSPALAPPQADRRITQPQTETAFPKTVARSVPRETSTPHLHAGRRGVEPEPHVSTAPDMPVPSEIEVTTDQAIPDVARSVGDETPKQITQSADFGENAPLPQHIATDVLGLRLEEETQTVEPPPSPALGRKFEFEVARSGRPSRAAGHAYAGGEEKSGQPPSPTISIGKIEVQFLPQEPRIPAPRPQPERTRGFDAYARARRGEPR
ncbi:MAG: hypothetical protein JNJ53_11885 [Rhizobiales bacterium]|nr:hypothetical protein [Hyphomicrobiales bacterium]